jgi:hypothetical protein
VQHEQSRVGSALSHLHSDDGVDENEEVHSDEDSGTPRAAAKTLLADDQNGDS